MVVDKKLRSISQCQRGCCALFLLAASCRTRASRGAVRTHAALRSTDPPNNDRARSLQQVPCRMRCAIYEVDPIVMSGDVEIPDRLRNPRNIDRWWRQRRRRIGEVVREAPMATIGLDPTSDHSSVERRKRAAKRSNIWHRR